MGESRCQEGPCVCACVFFCFVCFMEEEGAGSEGPPRAGPSGPSQQGHTQEAGQQRPQRFLDSKKPTPAPSPRFPSLRKLGLTSCPHHNLQASCPKLPQTLSSRPHRGPRQGSPQDDEGPATPAGQQGPAPRLGTPGGRGEQVTASPMSLACRATPAQAQHHAATSLSLPHL